MFVDSKNIVYQYNGGFSDLGRKIKVSERTTFNIYSITKTFTAASVIKLAQEGKVDLDSPISLYLPNFPYPLSPTIRQTLQHIAGFPNPNPLSWIHRVEEHEVFDEQAFIRNVTQENSDLDFVPGEKFYYSNIGYLLLGELVRNVSGKPFHEYVQSEIIYPLSISNKNEISFIIKDPENHAHGHIGRWNWLNLFLGWFIDRNKYLDPEVNGWVPFKNLYVNGNAYGGLVGNAGGLAVYLQAMLNSTEPFNSKMLNLLWTIGATNDGEPTRTGLAWFHGTLNGNSYFSHSGGAGGHYCEIRIYPEAKRASVIMTNNTGISDQRYLDRIDHFFLSGVDRHGS